MVRAVERLLPYIAAVPLSGLQSSPAMTFSAAAVPIAFRRLNNAWQ